MNGCKIEKISHSPSGQVVAHVATDSGKRFLMPFGLPITLSEIEHRVQEEVDRAGFVMAHAERLNQELVKKAIDMLPWHSGGLWEKIKAFLRRGLK